MGGKENKEKQSESCHTWLRQVTEVKLLMLQLTPIDFIKSDSLCYYFCFNADTRRDNLRWGIYLGS